MVDVEDVEGLTVDVPDDVPGLTLGFTPPLEAGPTPGATSSSVVVETPDDESGGCQSASGPLEHALAKPRNANAPRLLKYLINAAVPPLAELGP